MGRTGVTHQGMHRAATRGQSMVGERGWRGLGTRATHLLLEAVVGHWDWTRSPVEEVLVGGHLAGLHGGSGSSQLTRRHTRRQKQRC